MNVKELIEHLKTLPQDIQVMAPGVEEYAYADKPRVVLMNDDGFIRTIEDEEEDEDGNVMTPTKVVLIDCLL
jgi:hypothetical protein